LILCSQGVNRHLSKYFEGEMKRKNAICLWFRNLS